MRCSASLGFRPVPGLWMGDACPSGTVSSSQKSYRLHSASESGIEVVPESITREVDSENGQGEEHTGEEDHPDGSPYVVSTLSHDVPPTGNIWWRAGAQEAQICLHEDSGRADVRCLHDERGECIRQDVDVEDPER